MGHGQGRIAVYCLIVCGACVLLAACIGESAFRVRGKIATSDRPDSCVMKVYAVDGGYLAATRKVEPEFQESVVIAPGTHRYYITIECKGTSARYKSRMYKLGSVEHYLNPIDLGVISLKSPE